MISIKFFRNSPARIILKSEDEESNFKIPVLAVTAQSLSNDKQEAFNAGFTNYLSKPFQREEQFQMLTRYLYEELKFITYPVQCI